MSSTPLSSSNSAAAKTEQIDLFSPMTVGAVTLRNRIGVSPMCQYSSLDGFAEDWHLVHLGSRAVGGAGLVMVEATAVEAEGRISPDDLGLWKDEHIEALKRVTAFIERFGAVPAIQLAHAGRKASTYSPWKVGSRSDKKAVPESEGGWLPVAPSAIPFSSESPVPHELSLEEIAKLTKSFRAATERAKRAGFRWIELHAAHGYLASSFLSPFSNERSDAYGGSFENRIRFIVETVDEMRQEWPEPNPLSVRLSCSDWVEGGWGIDDSVKLSSILKDHCVDLVDCSSGFVLSDARYPYAPGWQVPFAEEIRRRAGIATAAVGMITEAKQADEIIRSGRADLVMIARQFIRDPYWPYHAALELGAEQGKVLPPRYSYAI